MDHPRGYPQLAAYIDGDDRLLFCRRFGFLHNRVMLYRQDELVEMEQRLIAMDNEDVDLDPVALMSRRIDDSRQYQQSKNTEDAREDQQSRQKNITEEECRSGKTRQSRKSQKSKKAKRSRKSQRLMNIDEFPVRQQTKNTQRSQKPRRSKKPDNTGQIWLSRRALIERIDKKLKEYGASLAMT